MAARRTQGIFWMLTIPQHQFIPYLPPQCSWIKGQLETGEGGFVHWQVCVGFSRKASLRGVREVFGPAHAEITRSEAAAAYVWKDESSIPGTRFEIGTKPVRRNSIVDWESVWDLALAGKLLEIPAQIRISHYRTLRAIPGDFSRPIAMVRTCYVFWGRTGTGKSRRAWTEAGIEAYPKDPRSKFWCGYSGQENVVIDEFRGGISIDHMLRWLDRYPVNVEIKGASVPLVASTYWITSNLPVECWFDGVDSETLAAFKRRLNITEFE